MDRRFKQHRIAAFFLLILCIILQHLLYAGIAEVETQISPDNIIATASSSYSGKYASDCTNGSGLNGWVHHNDEQALDMWHSDFGGGGQTNPHPGTDIGSAWIKFEFDKTYSLGKIWIWNHNQNNLTDRGLKKVTIQYSTDNINWQHVTINEETTITLARASGLDELPHTDEIDLQGIQAKYVVITASAVQGNYGSDYYGLSEVRFGIDGTDILSYCPPDDMNNDCKVNINDIKALAQNWLDAPSQNTYDLNLFSEMANNWLVDKRAEAVTQFIQNNYWEPSGLYKRSFPSKSGHYAYMWDNIVQMTVLTEAAKQDPAAYRSVLDSLFDAMNTWYWDKHRIPSAYQPGFYSPYNGDDRYFDDNGWAAIDCIYSYDITGENTYLQKAKDIFLFLITGWDSGCSAVCGGGFWHVSRNTIPDKSFKGVCNNASTAYAGLLLAQRTTGTESQEYLDQASLFLDWTRNNLIDSDALYFDAIDTYEGDLHPYKWTYNTAMMIRGNLLRYKISASTSDRNQALLSGWASDYFIDPAVNAYRDQAFFSHLLAEADLELYIEFDEQHFLDRATNTADYYWDQLVNTDVNSSTYDASGNLKVYAGMARLFWLLKDYQ